MNRVSFFGAAGLAIMLALGAAGQVFAQDAAMAPVAGTNSAAQPVDPALVDVPDAPGLPRILLIGDAISMGYTPAVRSKLEERANVHRPVENCGSTEHGLDRLDAWLGTNHWDVIHFNFGLQDLKFVDDQGKNADRENGKQVAPPDVYGRNLRMIALRLQKTGVPVIFATTTPVPTGVSNRAAGDEGRYNEMAKAVMAELNIPVDDLGGYAGALLLKQPPRLAGETATVRDGDIQLPFTTKFTPAGYDLLADMVVTNISKFLPTMKPKPVKEFTKPGVPAKSGPPPDGSHT